MEVKIDGGQQDSQYICVTLHAVTFQKTTGFVVTPVTTSNHAVKLVLRWKSHLCNCVKYWVMRRDFTSSS